MYYQKNYNQYCTLNIFEYRHKLYENIYDCEPKLKWTTHLHKNNCCIMIYFHLLFNSHDKVSRILTHTSQQRC